MSATVLISGKIQRDPERKVSKGGKPFVTATLREGDGEAVSWWNVLAFADNAIEELSRLKAGDALAASGSFKAELYEKNGAQRISYTVFADRIISARRQKREPSRQAAGPKDQSQDRFHGGAQWAP